MPIPVDLIPFDPKYVKFIREVLTIAEQGTRTIPYSKVEVMNDGPGNAAQITLSIGFTELGGNLKPVVQRYCDQGGALAAKFAAYLPSLGHKRLASDGQFKQLLKESGKEELMHTIQEECFEEFYLGPAFKWAKANGMGLPLSLLVICDSYLHSGSIPSFLRSKFPASAPVKDVEGEKTWITQYTKVRQDWLANHSNRLLRNTVYRTKYYLNLLNANDWQLNRGHEFAMNDVRPTAIPA